MRVVGTARRWLQSARSTMDRRSRFAKAPLIRPLRRLVASVVITSTIGMVSLRGSDPVPVQQAQGDESIAAAKQQLDGLKVDANSRAAGVQAAPLPSVAVPELTAGATTTPTVPAPGIPRTESEKQRDPANWLVDAMAKPKANRASRDSLSNASRRVSDAPTDRQRANRGDSATTAADLESDDLGLEPTDEPRLASRPDITNSNSADAERRDPAAPTFNPLAQYMSQWLTPRDYAVLRKTFDPVGTTGTRSAGDAPFADAMLGGVVSGPTPGGFDASLDFSRPAVATPSKPAENPFLQSIAPLEPSLPAASANISPVVPPPAAALPATPQLQSSPSALPDFVKPLSDEKYFKPLKRF